MINCIHERKRERIPGEGDEEGRESVEEPDGGRRGGKRWWWWCGGDGKRKSGGVTEEEAVAGGKTEKNKNKMLQNVKMHKNQAGVPKAVCYTAKL